MNTSRRWFFATVAMTITSYNLGIFPRRLALPLGADAASAASLDFHGAGKD